MSHNECKTEKLNDSQLFSLFILLSIKSKVAKILSDISPLNINTEKLKKYQKGLEILICIIISDYHE